MTPTTNHSRALFLRTREGETRMQRIARRIRWRTTALATDLVSGRAAGAWGRFLEWPSILFVLLFWVRHPNAAEGLVVDLNSPTSNPNWTARLSSAYAQCSRCADNDDILTPLTATAVINSDATEVSFRSLTLGPALDRPIILDGSL